MLAINITYCRKYLITLSKTLLTAWQVMITIELWYSYIYQDAPLEWDSLLCHRRGIRVKALSDDARLTSVCLSVCLSVAYFGPKSRTEAPKKTKIGTEVDHVTCDSDTTFKVRRSKVNLQGWGHIVAASHTACYYA